MANSNSNVAAPAGAPSLTSSCPLRQRPFYLIVAAGLALITGVFTALFGAVILIVLNFNLLDWIE